MYRTISVIALCAWASSAQAHEMIPTYPKMSYSHLSGVLKTSVQLFNKREEIEFYEIGVFDADFNPVDFATSNRVVRLPHLQQTTLEIYIRESDSDVALYICSESKLRKGDAVKTRIASRICSKIKK
jgi:hypothetical protein